MKIKGDAILYGRSIRHQMTQIRRSLGVCPQHDVLYANMTVREHLTFYAGLKGIPTQEIAHRVKKRVEQVGLTEKYDVK